MPLRLRVTGYDAQQMGAVAEHVFGESGGTIGRARSNDWCLPDPVVSGEHAVIRCDSGEYYLRDTSTNGTVVNSITMSRGDERPLHNGDVVKIGKFDISVEIDDQPVPANQPHAGSRVDVSNGHAETLDPLELLDKAGPTAKVELPPEGFDFSAQDAQSDHTPAESQGFQVPQSAPDPDPFQPSGNEPFEIPDDWDQTGFDADPKEPSPAPPPASPPPAPAPRQPQPEEQPRSEAPAPRPSAPPRDAAGGNEIDAMLKAAGVPPHMVSPETYAMLGDVIQVVVQGLVDVLRARSHIKDEFRVASTRLKPVENNPLKFSINAQDALHNLFGKSNPGFQSPVHAFQDSFEDIKAHQMAMIAGMRAAYQHMLDYFDPEELEAEFDRRLKRGVLGGVLNKTRYWDMYEDLYQNLVKDQDSSFHRLFGDKFGHAYEDQMDRLSKTRRK